MFADVSGFTALSEAMAKYGPEGAEYLAKHLNAYFGQMVKAIASEGGDIFKFAGDAMIVLWPDLGTMEARARRAAQCALAIQEALHAAELSEGVTLSVKIGIGLGRVSVLHLGGVLDRMEYVAVGDPLVQAFNAEGHAEAGGDAIVSPAVWKVIEPFVNALEVFPDGFAKLTCEGKGIAPAASGGEGPIKQRAKRVNKTRAMKDLGLDNLEGIPGLEKLLKCYVPGAILPWVSPESADLESWGGDLRNATVMFVNLGLKEHDLLAAAHYEDALGRAHKVLVEVQTAVNQYEGAVNKFLMDDKGSTLIAVWGLPPLSHEDDPTRGVLCGLAICSRLWDMGLVASCGITTGVVFCGVVGSTTRKEYSVLGDTVNLSARLMQRACKSGGGVICDLAVRSLAQQGLEFKDEGEIKVKGKSKLINIFKPYPKDCLSSMPPTNPPGSEPRVYHNAYQTQVTSYHSYATLRPHFVNPIRSQSTPGEGGQAAPAPAPTSPVAGASRRATKLMGALGGGGGAQATVDIAGGLKPGPLDPDAVPRVAPTALNPNRTTVLLKKPAAAYTSASTVTIEALKIHVPVSLARDSWLLEDTDYATLATETVSLDVSAGGYKTLRELRDAAVAAAQAQGLVPAGADANELRLQVDNTAAIIPASDLPMLWAGVFIAEMATMDPTKFDGTLAVVLVKGRDEAVLMPRHYAARQAMVEGKIRLLAEGQGGCVLLEGAMGTGKTWLLRQFVGQVMPERTTMFCANGSPFARSTPFAVWGALLRQYVDLYGASHSITSRTAVAQDLLKGQVPDQRLLPLASLLNPILSVNLPDSPALDKLTPGQKERATSALLMALVRSMVAGGVPATLVIDDAMYMHAASWDLALQLAAACCAPAGSTDSLPLLLVLSSRMPKPYEDSLMTAAPKSYMALLEAPFVTAVRISRLPRLHARALVQATMQWHGSVSEEVHLLVEARAQGNPLMVQEVLLSLLNKGRLVVAPDSEERFIVQRRVLGTALVPFYGLDFSGGGGPRPAGSRRSSFHGQLTSSKAGQAKFGLGGKLELVAGLATPVPFCHKVNSNLSMQVDRLPTMEQMVLKVGAIIAGVRQREELAKLASEGAGRSASTASAVAKRLFEHRFKFSVLFEVFPLKDPGVKDALGGLCQSLVERGFIVKSLTAAAGAGEGKASAMVSLKGDAAPAAAAAGAGEEAGAISSKEPMFEFTHSFVSDTVRLRVLAEQRKQLEKGIQESFRRNAEFLRRVYVTRVMESGGGGSKPNKSGWLTVRKNVPSTNRRTGVFGFGGVKKDWKRRWVCITGDSLQMFKEEDGLKHGHTPVQIIPVAASTATMLPPSQDLEYQNVFRVDSSHYTKKGVHVDESRSFYMAAEDASTADDWVFWISFMADKAGGEGGMQAGGGGGGEEATSAAARLITSSSVHSLASAGPEVFPRTRLVVTVEGAQDLPPAKQTGHTSPYVTLAVGTVEKSTAPVMLDRCPSWADTLALPVAPTATAEGVLRVHVWDKDKYGADSLIGVAEVPLISLPLSEPPPRPALDELLAARAAEGIPEAEEEEEVLDDFDDEEEEEEHEAYLEAARAETEAQAEVETTSLAIVAPGVLLGATTRAIQAAGGNWKAPLDYTAIMQEAREVDVNRGAITLRLRLVAEHGDTAAIQAARTAFTEAAGTEDDTDATHQSLAARALFLLGRADLSWLSSLEAGAASGAASAAAGAGLVDMSGEGPADTATLLDRLQSLSDMLTGMEETGAATLTKDALANLRRGLGQSMATLQHISAGGLGGAGADTAAAMAIAEGVGGSSAAGAQSFLTMVSLLDLDETNREWLASQYSKAGESEGRPAGRSSGSRKPKAARQSHAGRNLRRSSAIVINPSDSGTLAKVRRLSRGPSSLAAVSEQEVPEGQEWGPDAPGSMEPAQLHLERCLTVPGYLALGGDSLAYVQTWGRYGWGVQTLRHEEPEDPSEGEVAASAARGEEGGGWFVDLHERLTYEDTEDNLQGPFTARDIFEWHEEGYMPDDMMIRCGTEEDGGEVVLLQDIISTLAIRAHLSRLRELVYEAGEAGNVDSWGFNMFALEMEHPVHAIPIASYVFAALRLPKFFSIREDTFVAFLGDVCDRMCLYPDSTPYHNYWHVTDVLHAVYVMLTQFGAGALLTPVETLGLAVGALCHDLEHPGLGNSYQVKAQTELALRYNDTSVLESHHAALASLVVRDTALFGELAPEVSSAARKVMLNAILATDMTCHFGLTSDLRGVAERHADRLAYLTSSARRTAIEAAAVASNATSHYGVEGTPHKPADGYSLAASIPQADREIIYKTILHAADISNPCKPWELCKLWSDRVVEEFFMQGDREKQEGLPVSPNMDRDNTHQAKMSLNFIDFIVAPLFVAMTTLLPRMQLACDTLSSNRDQWESIVQQDLKATKPKGRGGAAAVEAERKVWKRRQTAFQEVLMPLAKLGATNAATDDARAMALSGLQTFVAANVVAEEDEPASKGRRKFRA